LDENGARYLIFLKLAFYQAKMGRGTKLLSSKDISWAFYSDSQDLLVNLCTTQTNQKLLWSDAKNFGMGYWIKSLDTLVSFFKILFLEKNDRNDC
jgi:hypothetical protein